MADGGIHSGERGAGIVPTLSSLVSAADCLSFCAMPLEIFDFMGVCCSQYRIFHILIVVDTIKSKNLELEKLQIPIVRMAPGRFLKYYFEH